MKKACFYADLERGKRWEEEVKKLMNLGPNYLDTDNTAPDFIYYDPMDNTEMFVEVKTDEVAERTGNLFIERYTSVHNKRPGGPWRAKEEGVHIIVYYLPNDRHLFWAPVEELVRFIENGSFRTALGPAHEGSNYYRSEGFLVPIEEFLREFNEGWKDIIEY